MAGKTTESWHFSHEERKVFLKTIFVFGLFVCVCVYWRWMPSG